MATSGPNYCGTCADVTLAGGTAWSNVTNAQGSSNWSSLAANASVNMPAISDSDWLYFTGFGFAIPGGATINGILAEVMALASGTATNITQANLIIGGSTGGTNMASTPILISSVSAASYSIGGSSNLWGLTPTVSNVNASNFGFAIVCHATALVAKTAYVYGARMSVTYTAAGVTQTRRGFFRLLAS